MAEFTLATLTQEQLDRLVRQVEESALEIATLMAERDSARQQSTVNTPAPPHAPTNASAQSDKPIVISSGTPTQHDSVGQRSGAASDGAAQLMPGMGGNRVAPSPREPREARRHVEFATTSGEQAIMAPMPLKPQRPPCFDPSQRGGLTVQSWVFTMNVFFDANDVESDAAKIRYAVSLLRGPAMDWWRVIVTSPRAYEPPSQEEGPTGPAVTWIGYMHEAERVDRYIGGLKPDISHEIMLRVLSNFNEILALAEKIDILRRPLLDKCVIVYLDDILVYSRDKQQHLADLEAVFKILDEHRLLTKGSKCKFFQDRLEFLGHIISEAGVEIDTKKLDMVKAWHPPTNITELQSFLGFVNYVRRFVPDMAWLTAPLTDLLRKGVAFTWGEKEHAAFSALKNVLYSPPILHIADPHRPFEVVTDASDIAIGAVLLQDFGNGLQPIAYESRKLHPPEKNYPIHDREMLAIVHAFKVWRCYLTGADVTVRTDHKSLQYLRAQPHLNPRQIRWLDFLESNFHYTVTYKKGASNIADALIRPTAQIHAILLAQTSPLLTGLFTHGYQMDPFFTGGNSQQFAAARGVYYVKAETDRIWVPGSCSGIITGLKFTSNFWRNLWQQFGTRLQFSSSYHPETDGQTERTNQTMEQLIRATCDDPTTWEQQLPLIEFAYKNSPSATTQQSPFYLNYGQDPTIPMTLNPDNPVPQAQQFAEILQAARTRAADAIKKSNIITK
ncbi:unnamed protein product, partial [Closterium sp. NIES-54]